MQIKSLRLKPYHSWRMIDTASPAALVRLKKLEHYAQLREAGCQPALALEVIGWSRATYYRWRKRYAAGISGLESRSRRPRNLRQRVWSRADERLVLALRLEHPVWGKRKIGKVLSRDYGLSLSISTVGRILSRLIARGKVQPASFYISGRIKPKKRRDFKGHARRWRYGMKAQTPGELVQVDHMTAHFPGLTIKEFKAVCPVSRIAVMRAYSCATANNGERFLRELRRDLPFAVTSIQVDGGSEFRAEFEQACSEQNIDLFVLPPRKPKYNGCVERANGSSRAEFYNLYQGELTVKAINQALAHFQHHYNHYRPHDGIDLETPMDYYQQLKQAA